MDKSKTLAIAGLVVLIGVGVVAAFTNINKDSGLAPAPTLTSEEDPNFPKIKACDVLTKKAVEETFAGDKIESSESGAAFSSNREINSSNCHYAATNGNEPSGAVVLLVRSALSELGAKMNKEDFKKDKDSNVKTVENIGDEAYYVSESNQLYVMKGNNWYILSLMDKEQKLNNLKSIKEFAQKLNFK